MATIHAIPPNDVVNPRVLEIVIPNTPVVQGEGRDVEIANRLFIFSGTILNNTPVGFVIDDNMHRFTFKLDLSMLPGHPVFDDSPFHFISVPDPRDPGRRILKATTLAAFGTFGWGDDAETSTWGIDAADVIEENDHLILMTDMALQGDMCGIGRVSYQINLLARAL